MCHIQYMSSVLCKIWVGIFVYATLVSASVVWNIKGFVIFKIKMMFETVVVLESYCKFLYAFW